VCPNGGACARGACQEPVATDAGVRTDAGLPPRDAGQITFDSGVAADAGPRDAGLRDAGLRDTGAMDVELLIDDPGANCVCSAPGAARRGGGWGAGALAALGLAAARRRRRGQPRSR
jgi:MYXO-CTERM domain-containing protein